MKNDGRDSSQATEASACRHGVDRDGFCVFCVQKAEDERQLASAVDMISREIESWLRDTADRDAGPGGPRRLVVELDERGVVVVKMEKTLLEMRARRSE